jgi:hypothetical protein
MGLTKVFHIILLCCSLFDIIKAQAVAVPANIEAQMKVLYMNTSALLVSQYFPITFTISNFTTLPSFGFGINDFMLNQTMNHIYFQSVASSLSPTSVTIRVIIDNSTKISKFSISYISIWNYSGIFVISRSYANV